jgi:hypothetical protein
MYVMVNYYVQLSDGVSKALNSCGETSEEVVVC